jgi:alpha-amylase
MASFHLALVIHAHQPAGNFASVQEDVYQLAYRPFVEQVGRRPGIKIAFHYSGILLDWLARRHPEYLERLQELAGNGQVELLGGGFYEPILSAIPDRDRLAQIDKLSGWLEECFGRRPEGAWLTERVWDPTLARTLAQAGIRYTLTDDYHFLGAGLEEEQLFGYYLTEWQGDVVRVLPGLKRLRYLLPFRMEDETIDFLRAASERHPGGLATMGDDLEKFGAWPETHRHVYVDGWLNRFFEAVEKAGDWLRMVLPGEYLNQHEPLGRIYLPVASYQEMGEWALPPEAGSVYETLLHRVQEAPDGERLARFVHGGIWHNFFRKYEEANHLHKRMLQVSRRYEELDRMIPPSGGARERYRQGYDRLLLGQCNDAYWHGVFGGLYAPHLRTAVYQGILAAEAQADQLDARSCGVGREDFNVDGREELLLASDKLGVVVTPGDGGTVAEIAYRPLAFNVINSLRRRPEQYHRRLREAQRAAAEARSIHDRLIVKEEGLERYLQYDRYGRHTFRTMLFGAARSFHDYRRGRLEESEDLAGGAYRVASAGEDCCALEARAQGCLCEVRSELAVRGASLHASWRLRYGGLAELRGGLELVLNLLAPDAHDRYLLWPGGQERLKWSGEFTSDRLALVDEWLNLRIDVRVTPAATWWVQPIYTVSQSEGGFEKVYQGSAILPHWPVREGEAGAEVRLELSPAR